MMVAGADAELVLAVLQADALHVGRVILLRSCLVDGSVVRIAVEVEAACLQRDLEVLARRDGGTGNLVIEEQVTVDLHRQLAELDVRITVLAFCPEALQRHIRVLRAAVVIVALVLSKIRGRIEAGIDMPVLVDLSRRLEAQQQLIVVLLVLGAIVVLRTLARIGVAGLTIPFHLVGIALEVADADAEVVELIGELRGELVDQGLIGCGYIRLGHSLGNHLSHLVARDVLVALERRIAVALDDAVGCELGYSVICPVVSRHIGEWVRCGKRRGCSTNYERRRQCRYKSLFHNEFLPSSFYTIYRRYRVN